MFRCSCALMVHTAVLAGWCHAQTVPETVRSISGSQMSRLLERAGAQKMIVTGLDVRLAGGRIVFNAEFAKNTDNLAWLIRLNLSDAELKSFSAECEGKGYVRTLDTSVSVRGKPLHSAVWVKGKTKASSLVLPDGEVPVTGLEDSRLLPIDELMRGFLKKHNAAGAVLAIAKGGRLVYARGFGYADVESRQPMQPDTVLRLASVSKPLTGVATLMLVDKGQLSLDDRVMPILLKGDYPQLKSNADQRWNDITIRHLLHHSGGWDRSVSKDPMFEVFNITQQKKLRHTATAEDILRYQLTQPLDFDPGQKYAYSNFGYSVLGRIISIAMGRPFEDCVAELILKPAHMQNTRLGRTRLEDRGENESRYYMQNPETHMPFWTALYRGGRERPKIHDPVPAPYGQWDLEVMDAHGGWVSTGPDLLRFVTQIDSSETPLLGDNAIAAAIARPSFSGDSSYWYGCGWNVRPVGRDKDLLASHNLWHNGALAGTSTLLVRRRDGFSWAVLFNTDKSTHGQRLSSLIDLPIHRAVDAVEFWPDYDLFDKL